MVNSSRWNVFLFFSLNPPFFGVWSLVFPPCVGRIPYLFHVFTDSERFMILLFLIFFYQSSFLGLFEKLSFCFWTKNSKKISLVLFKNWFFVEQTLVFLILTNFCYKLVFFSFLLFFNVFFWKISCVLCLNLWVSVQKKSPQKKFLILFILCLLFLLLLFLFCTLFFCFLISVSMIPLLVFALVMFVYSSCVYLLSLSHSLMLLLFN